MDPLVIAETAETPDVILDKGQGKFQITGKSLIENAGAFYKPVAEWLASYAKAPNPETNLSFKFEYLNIESSKSLLDLLTALDKVKGAKVTWYFNEEDEDMEEIGEELAELVNIPFEFKIHS
ncbi:MAG TPA: DUF1987 domain-containing protein [Cyclobacteriaceae bacterium]|nr:DUF1987 domain-containing protein [Cyclobacteriaceae bacterium]MCB9239475.1 DUF1987 domain-containing protein [Flammeovirgaceae bacterium]MCB0499597.1 DUF1987 domain-containing protein [Cyclobacteriaceae bacterium]MCO5271141.1 DUF1987 domain-containing protein [Cyclobacteriaceae bacterium]MCW5902653.1 DUF1987 domain-containing protein [Cyclobacteriaceae bacterium]